MKVIIASDSFKGSLSAVAASKAIAEGVRRVVPKATLEIIPLADGGEGTVRALVQARNGTLQKTVVKDPLGKDVEAEWGWLGNDATGIIEMAAASGLPLVPPEKRNPLLTTSYGTGQLVEAALKKGCKKIILGIGGSATTDFGTGLAQALGVRFYREDGSEITDFMNGCLMGMVHRIDMLAIDPRLYECEIFVACDVDNPLLGPHGAVYTYSPQKGATPEGCKKLERNMEKIAAVAQKKLRDVRSLPGAGAAGGMGGGLVVFFDAVLQSGIDLVLKACRFRERAKRADLIFTGEGQIDEQTIFGKTIAGVGLLAKEIGVPVIGLSGAVKVSLSTMQKMGLTACFSICNRPMTLKRSIGEAESLLTETAAQVMKLVLLQMR